MPQHLSAKMRVGVVIESAVVLSLSGFVLGARTWRAPARSTKTLPEIVKVSPPSVVPQRRRADI